MEFWGGCSKSKPSLVSTIVAIDDRRKVVDIPYYGIGKDHITSQNDEREVILLSSLLVYEDVAANSICFVFGILCGGGSSRDGSELTAASPIPKQRALIMKYRYIAIW